VIGALIFLLSLPVAVYFYAGIVALVDQSDPTQALVRLALRAILVFTLLLITPTGSGAWIGYAFLAVAVLHVVAQITLRHAVSSGRWSCDRID